MISKEKYPKVLTIILLSILLTYFFSWFSLISLVLVLLSLATYIIIFVLKTFLSLSDRWYYRLNVLMLVFIASIAFEIIYPLGSPVGPKNLEAPEKIKVLAEVDQYDRSRVKPLFFMTTKYGLPHRDSLRLAKIIDLYESDRIRTPSEKYHAAIVFQHSLKSEHYKIAYDLSSAAADSGISKANDLMKKSYDRWQMSLGNEQKYGTQNQFRVGF